MASKHRFLVRIWVYNPRNGILMQNGFEEPGDDVQDVRLVVDTIPTLAWSAGPDGSADFFNQRWLDYTGLSAKQALGSGWQVAIHPDDLPRILETFREALNSAKPYEVEGRFRRFDGEFRWFLFRGSPLRDRSGKVAKWYGTNTDLQERKRAEDALRASEAFLLDAQRLTRTCSWRHEVLSGKITISPEGLLMYGIEPEDDASSADFYFRRMHPKDRPEVEQAYAAALLRKTDFRADFRIVRPDGTIINTRSIGHPILDERGDVVEFVGASTDVTEHHRAEQALRRSEAYLAEAHRLAKTGSWAYSPAAEKCIYWSDEMLRIFGLDPQTSNLPDREEFLRLVHPEDRDIFNERIDKAFREKVDFVQDYRIVLTDGTIKHIHGIGQPVLDETGNIVEYVGTDVDVTERKRDEEKLRHREAELLEAQRLSHTGSWKHDIASGKVIVSPEVHRIFGVGPDEVTSTAEFWLSRNHPEDAKRIQELFGESEIQKTDYEADYRIVLPDGAVRHLHAIGHPVVNEKGDLVEFVGTVMDVTEYHRARADLEKAFEENKRLKDQLHDENVVLREQIDQAFMFEEIVGTSTELKEVLSRVMKVAPTDSSVLISGETGTGKELIARAIHKRSRRSQRAFVSVNCAALVPTLISSELFGHEKGAFTGALQRRLGRFEMANGGTIFLDEIGELPLDTQVALLRVLQEREFERVGGTQPVKIDVRVIAATNRDLEAAVANGTFRPDLYYRLNVFPIQVPPLRERQDDVLMLLEYFVQRFAQKMGKHFGKIDKRMVELFRSYPWPGNIRELQNVVERSVIVSSDGVFCVDAAWLSRDSHRVSLPQQPEPADTGEDVNRERQIIQDALAQSRGRVSGPDGAAARLRVPPSTLEHRIKKLRIRKSHFKLS
jgi:PAS domain S-box-containing protein